jgi:hypothetical protein
MKSILTLLLFGLSFTFSSCKACNKESKDPEPENRDAPKGSPDGASSSKPDDKKTEANDVVAEARRLALEARAEALKAHVALDGVPDISERLPNYVNWATHMDEYDKRILAATQAADRAEVLEAQAIELNLQRNPQRNLVVIERVARTTMWARFARASAASCRLAKVRQEIYGEWEPHDQRKIRYFTLEQQKRFSKTPEKNSEREADKVLDSAGEAWRDADKARADAEYGHEDGDSGNGTVVIRQLRKGL